MFVMPRRCPVPRAPNAPVRWSARWQEGGGLLGVVDDDHAGPVGAAQEALLVGQVGVLPQPGQAAVDLGLGVGLDVVDDAADPVPSAWLAVRICCWALSATA